MADKARTKLLVVEDEKNVGLTVVERLTKEGYEVTWARSKDEATLETSRRKFDLVLLDVGLPDGTGFDIAAQLRKSHPATAIIFLTAFGNSEDRIRGLELGAEDYIVKPFHLKELLLRIENGLKRSRYLQDSQYGEDGVKVGRATIHFARYQAIVDGKEQPLSQREASLLKLLVDRAGSVVSRDEILDQVWSEEEFPTSRTVDNFIMRLRRLVETDPENPTIIRSVRGVGYQLIQKVNS
jgi:DNA-binding response OmpR family regulator